MLAEAWKRQKNRFQRCLMPSEELYDYLYYLLAAVRDQMDVHLWPPIQFCYSTALLCAVVISIILSLLHVRHAERFLTDPCPT